MRNPIAILTLFSFIVTSLTGPMPQAQADDFRLPVPGVMVHLSPPLALPIIKGIKVYPNNPFHFDFILDKGDDKAASGHLKAEVSRLIKYFLTSITVPEQDLWVNLSPYEKKRIIPTSFGLTAMGRDLLAEDYMLKQITATLIYPKGKTGHKFWKKVYQEAAKKYHTTDIPVNTFNKVWILPEKAVVYENSNAATAYVVESRLKVMLEQDYLSLIKHEGRIADKKGVSALGSQIVREIVIPQLNKEVNEDQNFAKLRQAYSSLILAAWYKKKIKNSILDIVYADKNKIAGINIKNPHEKDKIYHDYLQAFKKGVYNYIKEEEDPISQEMVPRKYFSGGVVWAISRAMTVMDDSAQVISLGIKNGIVVSAGIEPMMKGKRRGRSILNKGERLFLSVAKRRFRKNVIKASRAGFQIEQTLANAEYILHFSVAGRLTPYHQRLLNELERQSAKTALQRVIDENNQNKLPDVDFFYKPSQIRKLISYRQLFVSEAQERLDRLNRKSVNALYRMETAVANGVQAVPLSQTSSRTPQRPLNFSFSQDRYEKDSAWNFVFTLMAGVALAVVGYIFFHNDGMSPLNAPAVISQNFTAPVFSFHPSDVVNGHPSHAESQGTDHWNNASEPMQYQIHGSGNGMVRFDMMHNRDILAEVISGQLPSGTYLSTGYDGQVVRGLTQQRGALKLVTGEPVGLGDVRLKIQIPDLRPGEVIQPYLVAGYAPVPPAGFKLSKDGQSFVATIGFNAGFIEYDLQKVKVWHFEGIKGLTLRESSDIDSLQQYEQFKGLMESIKGKSSQEIIDYGLEFLHTHAVYSTHAKEILGDESFGKYFSENQVNGKMVMKCDFASYFLYLLLRSQGYEAVLAGGYVTDEGYNLIRKTAEHAWVMLDDRVVEATATLDIIDPSDVPAITLPNALHMLGHLGSWEPVIQREIIDVLLQNGQQDALWKYINRHGDIIIPGLGRSSLNLTEIFDRRHSDSLALNLWSGFQGGGNTVEAIHWFSHQLDSIMAHPDNIPVSALRAVRLRNSVHVADRVVQEKYDKVVQLIGEKLKEGKISNLDAIEASIDIVEWNANRFKGLGDEILESPAFIDLMGAALKAINTDGILKFDHLTSINILQDFLKRKGLGSLIVANLIENIDSIVDEFLLSDYDFRQQDIGQFLDEVLSNPRADNFMAGHVATFEKMAKKINSASRAPYSLNDDYWKAYEILVHRAQGGDVSAQQAVIRVKQYFQGLSKLIIPSKHKGTEGLFLGEKIHARTDDFKNPIKIVFVGQEDAKAILAKMNRSKAMSASLRHLGGIDLTANRMPLQITNAGQAIKFKLDPDMLKRLESADGFEPSNITFRPLRSLQAFLGIAR